MTISTILLIDDDRDEWELVKFAISRIDANIKLMFAFNGIQALELLRDKSFRPDMILLDVNMPVMNGLEFLQYRSSIQHIAQIPLVVHTTCSEDLISEQAMRWGAQLVITKAITMEGMIRSINQAIAEVAQEG